jgi:hypothetical protein
MSATPALAAPITLAWDPTGNPEVVGYLVYVGIQSGVYVDVYDVGERTSFTYDAAEGRRYYFAVASYATGVLTGPLSTEVSGVASAPGPQSRVASVTSTLVGHAAGLITAMAALPDGRLLAIEDGQRVLISDPERRELLRSPALSLDTPAAALLLQLVVAPDFASSRVVYASTLEEGRGGRRELRITRYRELQNQLGEPAVVVPGIGLAESGTPRFAADERGRLYIALPSDAGSPAPGSDLYQGMLLRFEADGRVPTDSRAGSPILATGLESPDAVGWDAASGEILLVGDTKGGTSLLVRIPISASTWPAVPEVMLEGSAAVSGGALRAIEQWQATHRGEPTALALGPLGSYYVAFSTPSQATAIVQFEEDAPETLDRRLLLAAWAARQHVH